MTKGDIVLDTSVVAKWFFPEEDSQIALEIKKDFTFNRISICVPLLIYYEMNNLLKTAVKRLRLNESKTVSAYEAFLKINFVAYSSEELMKKTLKHAIKWDISSYDASYIALAEHLKTPFFTADQKLLNKVKNEFVFNLQDYGLKNES